MSFGGRVGQIRVGSVPGGSAAVSNPLPGPATLRLSDIDVVSGAAGYRLSEIETVVGAAGVDLDDVWGVDPVAPAEEDTVYVPARPWLIGFLGIGSNGGGELVPIKTSQPAEDFVLGETEQLPVSGSRLSEAVAISGASGSRLSTQSVAISSGYRLSEL